MRYWDGQQWTDYVSNAGVQATDPVGSPATAATSSSQPAASGWVDKVSAAASQAADATSAAVDSAAASLSSRSEQTTDAPAHEATATATPSVDPSNLIADELAKLAKLRDSGVLTDDEFAAQKAKLLA